ncbi:MAG: hypothetical protein OEV28_06400 [Nitrospirota bacterium]|nr:hypothetical protein [Nitrospirota bacterium]
MQYVAIALPVIMTAALVASISAVAGEISAKKKADDIFSDTMKRYGKDVQVITACDGRKRVIVEGAKEGEIMPREKAKDVAILLNGLVKYCGAEVVAVMPKNRVDIHLSIDGQPFFTIDERDMKLPVTLVHGSQEHTGREKQIWKAEVDRLVAKGYGIFHSQITGKNGISCDMCHPDASNTHPETYPKFQTQLKKVALLRDMINWCIEKPMEGTRLADDNEEMKALEAYILSTRKGVSIESGKH